MFSVATWNVERLASKHRRSVERELGRNGHDVLVLTETNRTFRPAPGWRLATESTPAPDRTVEERWVCIWIRDGVASTPLLVRSEPERSAAAVVQHPTLGALVIFGTVLPWRSDSRQADARGGVTFERSLGLQAEDLARLLAAHPGAHLVVAGDYNQEVGSNGPVGTARGASALTKFLDRFGLDVPTAGAGDPLLNAGWRTSIDHVAVSHALVSKVACVNSWPQHYPLGTAWPDHHAVGLGLTEA